MADDESLSVQFDRYWQLDPNTTFVNHGAFGACPKRVLNRQQELREQLEEQPVRFFDRTMPHKLDRARADVADFVGADPAGFAFVPNATTGVNAVLRSRQFDPGDELLVIDQAYDACRHALEFVAERSGADVVEVELPFPLRTDDGDAASDRLVDAIVDAVTPRTELLLVDHVPSPTGVVLPVGDLVDRLDDHHLDVLVDGAHAPGMIDLDVDEVGATYYVGNCHKWLSAPKGAAFLWVGPHERDETHPTTIGKGWGGAPEGKSQYHAEFDWTGTTDPTPWICVPEAIDHLGSLVPEGWSGLRQRNHELALQARDLLCEALDVDAPVPDSLVGSMAAVPLLDPPPDDGELDIGARELERNLASEHGIEVSIKTWPTASVPLVRASAHLYNERADYEELAAVLPDAVA